MKEGWKSAKMSEVFELQMGKTPSRDKTDYWGGTNVWVAIGDMGMNKYIGDSKEHISDQAIEDTGIKHIPKGTVIMSFKLSVGKVAITSKSLYTNEAIMAFKIKEGNSIIPDYVFYYLKGYKWDGVNRAVMGMTLNKSTISQGCFNYPSLAEQERIVAELDLLTEIIDKQKAQLKELDALAQSIFYDMFGDPVENERGWKVKKLNEVVADSCTISYGIVQPGDAVEDGVPIVRPVDLTGTFVNTTNLKKTTKEISESYSRTILTGEEILVCVRGTTGTASMASPALKGCNVTRGITPLLFGDAINKWFVYFQLQTAPIRHIIDIYTKGITLKQINMADLRNIPLIIPPLSLQQSFADKINVIEQQKAAITQSIAETQKLFDYTMDTYFG